jgi:hypothetical protein
VGTPKPGTSMPMMRTPLICLRQQLQRHAAGRGHAQVDDDDGVVQRRVGLRCTASRMSSNSLPVTSDSLLKGT